MKPSKNSQRKQPNRPLGSAVAARDAEELQIGDLIVVTIKRIGINGEGVGYYKKKAVFIPGALPTEVVKLRIQRIERTFLQGEIVKIERVSPERVEPTCPVYDACGGCQLQHMSYKGQLQAKEEMIREAFARYTDLENLPLRPILGMDDPWGYRNKAQLQAGMSGEQFIAGLYETSSRRLVDISGCQVQHPEINRTVDTVREILQELGVPAYDERTRRGAVRTIVARVGFATGKVQVTLVTAGKELPHRDALVRLVRERLPQVTSIAHNINTSRTPLVFGDETRLLWGSEHLDEALGDVRFQLSPRAFFQLNPSQTIKLYDAVKEAAALTGQELVVDAYCGTGTIGLWLAPYAKEVRGIELIPEAVADARRNAELSGLSNARFFAGYAEKLLPEWVRQGIRPDVVVVDPPRTGCAPQLLEAMLTAKPSRLIYVSCNPSTLAKDCKVLLSKGYRVEWIQPVDMFPQTAHVEVIVKLEREGRAK